MSWFVVGDGGSVQIKILESGLMAIYGWTDNQDPRPSSGSVNHDFYNKLKSSKCRWSIHPNNESEIYLDPAGTGFYEELSKDLCKPLSSIHFFEGIQFSDECDFVGITIALPQESFDNAIQLFQNVLLNQNLEYMIKLDFSGFWANQAETVAPSFKEFLAGPLDGKGYFSKEASFAISRNNDNA